MTRAEARARIHQHAQALNTQTPRVWFTPWIPTVIPRFKVTAFAVSILGGHIVIRNDTLTSPDADFILAHETGHIAARHTHTAMLNVALHQAAAMKAVLTIGAPAPTITFAAISAIIVDTVWLRRRAEGEASYLAGVALGDRGLGAKMELARRGRRRATAVIHHRRRMEANA